MKIIRIAGYGVELPRDRIYRLSGGRTVAAFDTTIVTVETNEGLTGVGEVCPLGSAYLPAFVAGARAGISEIAPALIGADPTQLENVNAVMDQILKGHPYAKSALDIACWDILGQAAGVPVYALLGGCFGDRVELYQSIPQGTPDGMAAAVVEARAEGFGRFQPKVGGEPDVDIERIHKIAAELDSGEIAAVDANGGWLLHEAARVANAIRDLDIYFEQPCASYEDCLSIRRRTELPLVLDEVIDSLPALLRAHADGAMDAVNLKISKLGGLTRTRLLRDVCRDLGIAMTLEDSGGGDVIGAAIAHLCLSTPERLRFGTASGFYKVKRRIAEGALTIIDGCIAVPAGPGLGVTLRRDVLAEPFFEIAA